MEDQSKIDAVIAKVRKLLVMAEGQANQHESEVAARLAQELLEAYNLDMATVNLKEGGFAPREKKNRNGGLYKWQRALWFAVATQNFCKYYYIRGLRAGSNYEHQLIGSKANVIGTELMAEYLEQTIERLARIWVHKNRPGRSIFIKEAIAYREGVADDIIRRLWEMRWAKEAEDRRKVKEERARNAAQGIFTENALVLQDVLNTEEDLNDDFINGWEPGTSARLRKEREERQRLAQEEADKKLKEQEAWDLLHPVEAAARKRREDAEAEERDRKFRTRYSRDRKPTPEEERRRLSSFRDGQRDGANVSLSKQVDKHQQKRLE